MKEGQSRRTRGRWRDLCSLEEAGRTVVCLWPVGDIKYGALSFVWKVLAEVDDVVERATERPGEQYYC